MATTTAVRTEERAPRLFYNSWQASVAAGRREKEYSGTIIPSARDKPFLLCGLLVLYCLHSRCCAHDFGQDSDSAMAQVLGLVATNHGIWSFVLVLMVVAAICDAITEVEVEVREQERLRLK